MREENTQIVNEGSPVESPLQGPVEGSSSATEKMNVKRGRIGQFKLYEVAEHELLLLEKGSDSAVWLNFAVSGLSIFCSILAALLTLDASQSPKAFIVFVVITVVSAIVTLICVVFWFRNRKTGTDILDTIRKRIPD